MEKAKRIEPSLVSNKYSNSDILTAPRENIGRWDDNEHKLFLEGLQRYGNDWKQIANMISTRNLVQVRTHAQKYFQKINKNSCTKTVTADYRKRKDPVKPILKETSVPSLPTVPSPVSVMTVNSSVPPLSIKSEIVIPPRENTTYVTSNLTPRSPIPNDYVLSDYEYVSDYYRGSYFNSTFDLECNSYLDDLEFFDYADLKTPVFD